MLRKLTGIISILSLGLLLTACSGQTTGARYNIENAKATLTASGQCDQKCEYYFFVSGESQYVNSTVGTALTMFKTPVRSVNNKTSRVSFSETVQVERGYNYKYQLCGRETSWSNFVCVGPNGTTNSWSYFKSYK